MSSGNHTIYRYPIYPFELYFLHVTTMNKKHKTVLKTIDMKTLDNVSLYECTSYFQQKQFIVLAKQGGKNIFENCVLILCWTLSAKKKI